MSLLQRITPKKRRNSSKNKEGTSDSHPNISDRYTTTNKRQDGVKNDKQKVNKMNGKTVEERLQNDEVDEILECERCGMNVDCMIECECCNEWLCINCGEISSQVMTIINKYQNAVHFYCQRCTITVQTLIKKKNEKPIDNNMDNVEKIIKDITTNSMLKLEEKIDAKLNAFKVDANDSISVKIDKSLAQLEEKFESLSAVPEEISRNCKTFAEALKSTPISNPINDPSNVKFKNIVKEALDEEKREEKELDDRKRNIIIFGAPEHSSDSAETRKVEDIKLFTAVCNSICTTEIREEDTVQARRLGKRATGNSTRPLLITVKSETIKKRIFSQLHKLRSIEQYKHIRMNHDMTAEEKANTKMLVEEARRKSNELAENSQLDSDSKNCFFKVRGPPWNLRIVKLRPQSQ